MSSLLPRYFGIWYSFINLHVFRMGGEPMELETIVSWIRGHYLPEESVQIVRKYEMIRRKIRLISLYLLCDHALSMMLYMIYISNGIINNVSKMLQQMIWVGIFGYFYLNLFNIKHFWKVLLRLEIRFISRVPDRIIKGTILMTYFNPKN